VVEILGQRKEPYLRTMENGIVNQVIVITNQNGAKSVKTDIVAVLYRITQSEKFKHVFGTAQMVTKDRTKRILRCYVR